MFNFYGFFLALSAFLITIFNTPILGSYYDAPKRLLLSFLLLIMSFIYFVKDLELRIPTDKKIIFPVLSSFLFLIVSIAVNKSGMHILGLTHIVIFLIGTIVSSAFYNTSSKEEVLKSFIYFHAIGSTLCILWLLIHELLFPIGLKPFFGNPNPLSEYLMLATINFVFLFNENKKYRAHSLLMGALSVGLILHLGGRASFIGIPIALFIYLYTSKAKFWLPSKKLKTLLIFAVFFVGIASAYLLLKKGTESLGVRFALWGNTLHLISDKPWGTGPGNLELSYGPYNNGNYFKILENTETVIIANPHNTYLEIAAEIGILGALSVFLFVFFLVQSQFNKKAGFNLTSRWTLSNFAALAWLGLSAFPQDNIFTLYFLSICFGFAMSNGNWKKTLSSRFSKIFVLSAAILLCSCVVIKSYSSHQTYLFSDNPEKRLGTACALDSENWKACIGLIEFYTLINQFESAQKQLEQVEKRFPDFYALLSARGELKIKLGDIQGACIDLKTYDSHYPSKTKKTDWISANCPIN